MSNNESRLEAPLSRGGQRQTHGGYSFLVHGRLPDQRVRIQRHLSATRASLVTDLGGSEDNLSAQQIILIDRCISLLGVLRCIEEHCKEKGVFKGDSLQPSLGKNYISFTNSLKQILQLLGIGRNDIGKEMTPEAQAEIIKADLKANERNGATPPLLDKK